jgi:alpha-tubulin suppressor-like RCC1 family protein
MKSKLQLLVITLVFASNVFSQTGTGCWRMVSAGTNFSLGIKMDGTLWGWGANGNLLGLNGVTPNQNLAVQIGTANDWATVSAGTVHSLAVKTNGTLWAWGNGQFGQLGNGAFNSATWTVTQVGTANDWLTVSAGNRFSLAIKTTGTLWSWGLNNLGQLGQNNLIDLNLPTQLGTANNWLKIDAGNQHSLAIDNTGFMYAWGDNTFGQFGNATNTSSLIPILVSSANNWAEVSAGFDHSMALDTNGILFTAGNNSNGQLCDGTNTASNSLIPISFSSSGIVTQYIAISAGNNFSLAIKNDNTLWSGGFNSTGQLGLGNNTAVNVLTQVGTSNTWFLISAGDAHSLAMETTTSLWSTGRNLEGALGIGTFTFSYNTLQSVGCPTTALATEEVSTENNKTTVYPNPTNDIVNVDFTLENSSNVSIQLTNIQGQLITEIKMENTSGLQTATLNLSNQSSGMYFITVTSQEKTFTTKVIKR